jgi:protein ImuB
LPGRRYLALFFPLLSADRWLREGREAPGPIVFIEKQRGAMRIVATGEEALTLGIAPGMMLADARARIPDLFAVDHDPPGDAALLLAMAEDCDRYTPSVALDPPDGLILDITGCTHLWGDEAGLVSALAARLAQAGLTLRLALAETPDKARALARHGGELLAVNRRRPPEMLNEERAAYDAGPVSVQGQSLPLPIAALDLDNARTMALRRAGLYTIGDLAARPRAPLAARFGKVMVARLARVLGEEDIRITPLRTPPALFFLRRFAEPVGHSDIVLATIGALAGEAEEALRQRGQGGRDFRVRLYRSDGAILGLTIGTGAPTRDPALLIRLFRERIDSLADPLDPGFGYDAMRLDVTATEALATAQSGFEGEAARGEALGGLIDRLGIRLGRQRVRRLVPGNSHIPELAGLSAPASAPPLPLPWIEAEPGEPPVRPLFLYDPPHRVDVIAEVPDGPPRSFRWRRTLHQVIAHEGPERIAAEWWRRRQGHEPGRAGLTRDYYRVEDSAGRRFWLFRHGLYGDETGQPDWYLHGRFC